MAVLLIILLFLGVGFDILFPKRKRYHTRIEGKWDTLTVEITQDVSEMWKTPCTYFIVRTPRGRKRLCQCSREIFNMYSIDDVITAESKYGRVSGICWATTYVR